MLELLSSVLSMTILNTRWSKCRISDFVSFTVHTHACCRCTLCCTCCWCFWDCTFWGRV